MADEKGAEILYFVEFREDSSELFVEGSLNNYESPGNPLWMLIYSQAVEKVSKAKGGFELLKEIERGISESFHKNRNGILEPGDDFGLKGRIPWEAE